MSNYRKEVNQNFVRYLERGDYYQEQGNSEQALTEYAKTFKWYCMCLRIADNPQNSAYSSVYSKIKIQVDALFTLAELVKRVAICYILENEYRKVLFFASKQKEIAEVIGKYQQTFDANNLHKYEELIEEKNLLEFWVRKNELSEFDNESEPNAEPNETFREICSNYDEICSLEICLLPSRVTVDNNNSCFIATASYTTSIHPDLDTFRKFRDSQLLTNIVGRLLVKLYYKVSPTLADYITRKPAFRKFLRCQLERLAQWMRNQ